MGYDDLRRQVDPTGALASVPDSLFLGYVADHRLLDGPPPAAQGLPPNAGLIPAARAVGQFGLGLAKNMISDVTSMPAAIGNDVAALGRGLKVGLLNPGAAQAMQATPAEQATQRQAGAAAAGLTFPFPGATGLAERAIPAAVPALARRLVAGGVAGAPAGALDAILRGGATPASVGGSAVLTGGLNALLHGIVGRAKPSLAVSDVPAYRPAQQASLGQPVYVPPPPEPRLAGALRGDLPPAVSRQEFEATGRELLHGTSREFPTFAENAPSNKWPRAGGFFFTEKPDVASRFAEQGGRGKIRPIAQGYDEVSGKSLAAYDARPEEMRPPEDILGDIRAARAKGYEVYRYDDNGNRVPFREGIDDPHDEGGLVADKLGDRVIKAPVYGGEADLTDPKNLPPDLMDKLKAARDPLYDSLRGGTGDYVAVGKSKVLREWAAEHGITKVNVKDAYESGFRSVYVTDPRAIGYGQDPYSLLNPPQKGARTLASIFEQPADPYSRLRALLQQPAAQTRAERALQQMHEAEQAGFPVGKHESYSTRQPEATVPPSDEAQKFFDALDAAEASGETPLGAPPKPSVFNAPDAASGVVQAFTKISKLLRARGPEASAAADLLEMQLHNGIRRVGEAEQHFAPSGLFDLPIGERLQLDRAYRTQDPSGLNEAQKKAYDAMNEYFPRVSQDIMTANEGKPITVTRANGDKVPFQPAGPGYLPKYVDPRAALRRGAVRERTLWNMRTNEGFGEDAPAVLDDAMNFILGKKGFGNLAAQRMVDAGKAQSVEEALGMLRRMKSGVQRASSIEFARSGMNNPFYDPDPAAAVGRYIHTVEPRVAQIQTLGQDQQVLNTALARIPDQQMKEDAVRLADVALEKHDQALSNLQKAAGTARHLAISRFGPWTTLANATQHLNSGLASDFGPLAFGAKQAMTAEGERIARQSGAVSGAAMHHYLDIAGGGTGGLSDAYLKAIGFTQAETLNRRVAANVGYLMAKKYVGRLLKNPNDARAISELKLLNINPADVAKAGKFTDAMGLDGALKFSSNTQFRSAPLDLPPEATRTEMGKLIAQFKAFAYQQTDLVQRETLGRLRQGQTGRAIRNALILGSAFPATGMLVNRAQNFVQGRPNKNLLDEYFGGLQKSAAGGLPGNVLQAAELGRKQNTPAPLLEEVGAPTIGMAVEAGQRGYNGLFPPTQWALRDAEYQRARDLGNIPAIGSTIAPWFSPYGDVGTVGLPAILRKHGLLPPLSEKAQRRAQRKGKK